jgi:hypothetical protein
MQDQAFLDAVQQPPALPSAPDLADVIRQPRPEIDYYKDLQIDPNTPVEDLGVLDFEKWAIHVSLWFTASDLLKAPYQKWNELAKRDGIWVVAELQESKEHMQKIRQHSPGKTCKQVTDWLTTNCSK